MLESAISRTAVPKTASPLVADWNRIDLTTLPEAADQTSPIRARCRLALDRVRKELFDARTPSGYWTGELAASALSTATAVSAIAAVILNRKAPGDEHAAADQAPIDLRLMIRQGVQYLRSQQNSDGGFGDTDRSHSNIATSYLVLAASTLAEKIGESPLDKGAIASLNSYLDDAGRLEGLRQRYGTDKTFVVPIMNNMAIAGLISWDEVAALPFEAAVFPQSMYRFLRMPVVSYAIPALVAIGQARHFLGRRSFFPLHLIRKLSVNRTLAVLERMQPASGGYLEATPLTAFVVMSLAATGRCDLPVVQNGLRFLKDSMLAGGRWPIDTNLATWVTSLSIHALACDPDDEGQWYSDELAGWHLDCQHRVRHPFTGAEPGGWGWTDLSGAVPDGDDTPAAILAIGLMRRHANDSLRERMEIAAGDGVRWLLKLQNGNGGWPTFCRGWGKLPFDRSSTDLTAHALRAMRSYESWSNPPASEGINDASFKGLRFLTRQQCSDGSWMPLWFGNQDRDDESNPVYGTSKVLLAAGGENPGAGSSGAERHSEAEAQGAEAQGAEAQGETAAVRYLLDTQNEDGGWGGGPSVAAKTRELVKTDPEFRGLATGIPQNLVSSVEETALAVEALATVMLRDRDRNWSLKRESGAVNSKKRSVGGPQVLTKEATDGFAAGNSGLQAAILRGVDFLTQSIEDRRHQVAWPIGFYFAKLWYHERLYPLIFTAAALGKVLRATDGEYDPHWPR